MARLGVNSWMSVGGTTPWEVLPGNSHVAGAVASPIGGGLRFWWVRRQATGKEHPPHWRFRVQRDAVRWKQRMAVRYP